METGCSIYEADWCGPWRWWLGVGVHPHLPTSFCCYCSFSCDEHNENHWLGLTPSCSPEAILKLLWKTWLVMKQCGILSVLFAMAKLRGVVSDLACGGTKISNSSNKLQLQQVQWQRFEHNCLALHQLVRSSPWSFSWSKPLVGQKLPSRHSKPIARVGRSCWSLPFKTWRSAAIMVEELHFDYVQELECPSEC